MFYLRPRRKVPVTTIKMEKSNFLAFSQCSKVLWPHLKVIHCAELVKSVSAFPSIFPSHSLFLHEVKGHSGVNESIVPEGEGWLCGEDYLLVLSSGIQLLLAYEPLNVLHH